MKTITHINSPLISVEVAHTCLGTDGPVGALIIEHYQLNEYEFHQLKLEIAKGHWKNYRFSYSGTKDKQPVTGEINSDGSCTQSIDEWAVATNIIFEILKVKNCMATQG